MHKELDSRMNAEVRPMKTAAESALAASFAATKGALPGAAAVAALREEAFHRFERGGLPNRRGGGREDTPPRAAARGAPPPGGAAPPGAQARADRARAPPAAARAGRPPCARR